jgi:hypothetical protein
VKIMTFKELAEGLSALLSRYPELANKEIRHASECGHSVAGFEKPLGLAVPIPEEKTINMDYIQIISDDDGYWTNSFIKKWEFLYLKEKE